MDSLTSRLGRWPLLCTSLGMVFGLLIGMALATTWQITMLEQVRGPALGGVIGLVVGLVIEWE